MRMHRIGRLAVVSGTAAAIALGSAAGATAAVQPAAKPKPHNFVFTKKHEAFNFKDSIGRFHAQVKLNGKYNKKYPMPWAFVITSKKLKAIARGKATCTATGLNGKYHDKHVIAVGYTWHSTVQPHRAKKVYNLSGTCVFRVQVGTKPGTAYVGFAFRYAIDPTKKTKVVTQTVATTKVRIAA